MCRIAGIIDRSLPIEVLKSLTREMCDLQQHGGPDDEGIYASEENHLVLGNRRLALLDLSPLGHMPMTYGDRYTITYNGEIFNFLPIKQELKTLGHLFHTGTDTEVILAAFAQWGTNCFKRFNGMFGVALWDAHTHNLYLARGVSGIKPLYYAVSRGKLAFASEVRAFAPISYLRDEDPDWRIYMMAYGNLPEPNTTLKNVKMLPKGSFLKDHVPTGEHRISNYFHYSLYENLGNRPDVLEQIKTTFTAAVDRHLVSDAPIGVFLSGGLDSSLVSLLANQSSKSQLNTLSIYFKEANFSEKKYQDIVLEQMNCRNKQYLLSEEDFHRYLPDICNAMDLPSADGVNTWFISKYARESGLKAVLSGIGGDELFGGYPSFDRIKVVSMLEKLSPALLRAGRYSGSRRLRRLAYLSLGGAKGKYLFLRGQFIPSEIAQHLGLAEDEVWEKLEADPSLPSISHLTLPNQVSWMELNMYMQNQLLRDSDIMSMAHGLEIRVPFLDREFMTLAMQVKSEVKYAGSFKKQLLIDAFKDILPEQIWNRPKMGFSFPFREWMTKDNYVRGIMSSAPEAKQAYDQFIAGKLHWSQLMTLLLIERKNLASNKKVINLQPQGIDENRADNYITQKHHKTRSGKNNKTLFLTLQTFSATGGIEKVCRVAGKALHELALENNTELAIYSMHDKPQNKQNYFPSRIFKGFNAKKKAFVLRALNEGKDCGIVVMSHVNLLSIGYLIKLFSPNTKLVLFAHGIEVWRPLPVWKKKMLESCDLILPVSLHTKNVMMKIYGLPAEKLRVLNNCLDPSLSAPVTGPTNESLLKRYNLKEDDLVMMTLTRLSENERYKGYDQVLRSLKDLLPDYPKLKYLVIGKYDAGEKKRVDSIIKDLGVEDSVIFAGFIQDDELAEHFNLADLYIMPSEKEGFGIVFIEAMYYGTPVIAGNMDGSVDALCKGELGLLVNPENQEEINTAIVKVLTNIAAYSPDQQLLMDKFGYEQYKKRLNKLLYNLENSAGQTLPEARTLFTRSNKQ